MRGATQHNALDPVRILSEFTQSPFERFNTVSFFRVKRNESDLPPHDDSGDDDGRDAFGLHPLAHDSDNHKRADPDTPFAPVHTVPFFCSGCTSIVEPKKGASFIPPMRGSIPLRASLAPVSGIPGAGAFSLASSSGGRAFRVEQSTYERSWVQVPSRHSAPSIQPRDGEVLPVLDRQPGRP